MGNDILFYAVYRKGVTRKSHLLYRRDTCLRGQYVCEYNIWWMIPDKSHLKCTLKDIFKVLKDLILSIFISFWSYKPWIWYTKNSITMFRRIHLCLFISDRRCTQLYLSLVHCDNQLINTRGQQEKCVAWRHICQGYT